MPKITRQMYVVTAQLKWHDEGVIEIDDNAKISKGDEDGAYVQAWIWVSNKAALEQIQHE